MYNIIGFVAIGVGSLMTGWLTAKCMGNKNGIYNLICGLISNILIVGGTALVIGG
jgi:uncharacterized membrane protein